MREVCASIIAAAIFFGFFFFSSSVLAAPPQVVGRILLQVESYGQAWYVFPGTEKRFYLKDGFLAYTALESFGLGITNENLQKIPVGLDVSYVPLDTDGDGLGDELEKSIGTSPTQTDTDQDGYSDYTELINGYSPIGPGSTSIDMHLVNQLKGQILLQVEDVGQAWYVNPADGKRYYMQNGDAAYQIMRQLSLGITNEDLARIPLDPRSLSGDGSSEPPPASSPIPSMPPTIPSSAPVCFLIDDEQTYTYGPLGSVLHYSKILEGVSERDCRDQAMIRYHLNTPVTYTLRAGDEVTLANNITVHVEAIDARAYSDILRAVYIHTKHSLRTAHGVMSLETNLSTYGHGFYLTEDPPSLENESYGYRIEYLSISQDKQAVTVRFTPLTPYIRLPQDLTRDCMLFRSIETCHVYSIFEPLEGEVKIEYGKFIVFGPQESEEYLRYFAQQAEVCYADATAYFDEETDLETIPIRMFSSGSVFVTTRNGITWISQKQEGVDYASQMNDGCEDQILAHELTHIILLASNIPQAMNEGLASYYEQLIARPTFKTRELFCQENGYELYGIYHPYGKINLMNQIPFREGGFDLYYTGACFWEEFEREFGQQKLQESIDLIKSIDSFGVLLLGVLEQELDIDLFDYRSKYGFDYTEGGKYGTGVAERTTGFLGSSGSKWEK